MGKVMHKGNREKMDVHWEWVMREHQQGQGYKEEGCCKGGRNDANGEYREGKGRTQ